MGPLKLRLKDPEYRYLRDLEGEEPAPGSKSPIAISMPWAKPGTPVATPVSQPAMPPSPAPPTPQSIHPMAAGPAPAASKSRFAKAPAASTLTPQAHAAIDEQHPALAARRPAPDEVQSASEPTMVRKAHRTMVFAAVVLVAILVAVVLIVAFGGPTPDE